MEFSTFFILMFGWRWVVAVTTARASESSGALQIVFIRRRFMGSLITELPKMDLF